MNVQPSGGVTAGEPLSNSPASIRSPRWTPEGVLRLRVGPPPFAAELAARKTISSPALAVRLPWMITAADRRNRETNSAVKRFVSGTGVMTAAPVERVLGVENDWRRSTAAKRRADRVFRLECDLKRSISAPFSG